MQGKDRDMFRSMRHCLGIRQVWLAKQTGIYRTKLSDFELGHLELSADELQRVKDAVGGVVRERAEAGTLPPPHGRLSQDSLMQGKVVKQLRCWYGITQAELGRKCGLSHDSISLFENGYFELDRSERTRMDKALEDTLAEGAKLDTASNGDPSAEIARRIAKVRRNRSAKRPLSPRPAGAVLQAQMSSLWSRAICAGGGDARCSRATLGDGSSTEGIICSHRVR